MLVGRDAQRLEEAAGMVADLGRRVAVRQVDLADAYALEDLAAAMLVWKLAN